MVAMVVLDNTYHVSWSARLFTEPAVTDPKASVYFLTINPLYHMIGVHRIMKHIVSANKDNLINENSEHFSEDNKTFASNSQCNCK